MQYDPVISIDSATNEEETMQVTGQCKKSGLPEMTRLAEEPVEHEPMHPDDFDAHYAWVTAKRFHELVLKETFAEKPVYYRILG